MKIFAQRFLLLVILISIALVFPSLSGHAENTESSTSKNSEGKLPPPDKEEKTFSKPEHMFPSAEEVSGSKLEEQRDKYLSKRGWKLGFTKKGSYIGWGEAKINVRPNDLIFGQKRVQTFLSAFADAKGEYVRTKQRTTTSEMIREKIHDDREPSRADLVDQKSRVNLIGEKVMALSEAKLDKMLQEEGVDPSEIKNKSVKQKRLIAKDSLSRSITVRSIQSVAGVRIIATFEDLESVGVLIVASDKMRQIAQAVADGKTVGYPSKQDPKETIRAQIESRAPDAADLAYMHGVRVMTDDNGDRALVAFGQWSPKITKNDSKMKQNMAIDAAREIALDQADGSLNDFINSTVALRQKSKIEGSDVIEKLIRSDSEESLESNKAGASIDKLIKQHGHTTLQGTTTIKRWVANHPETGHLLVGHILMWSPATRDAAARSGKRDYASKSGRESKTKKYQNKVRQSADFEDDSDF